MIRAMEKEIQKQLTESRADKLNGKLQKQLNID